MALNIGDRVGPFELLEEIGSGGMGVVFRARQVERGDIVAVKTLASSSSLRAARLRHEAEFLRALDHPGVMPFVDAGEGQTRDGDPLPWFAMALQPAMTLAVFRDRLFDWAHDGKTESGRWTPAPHKTGARRPANDTALALAATKLPEAARGRLPEVEEIASRLCEALAHVHAAGIVHCDVAPANIFLQGLRPILADFDIAQRVHTRCDGLRSNRAPAGAGTSHYMSPEQFTGAPLDARSDLYGLGCLLYELLTGRPPFTGSPATIREGHIYRPVRSPCELVNGIAPPLEDLIMALLAKEPHERPPFALDVQALLDHQRHAREGRRAPPRSFNPSYLYSPRFFGRPELLGRLNEQINLAQRGKGSMVLVRGAAGSGKSRLLYTACEAQAIMAVELNPATGSIAQPVHWSRSFTAVFDYASTIVLSEADGPLSRWIARRGSQVAPYSESIAELTRTGSVAVTQEVLVEAIVDLLRTLAGDRGLVLLADNLHLFPTPAQACLTEATSTGDPRARPLVLASAPADWRVQDARSDSAQVIDLAPLEASDLTSICEDALADCDLPDRLVAHFVMTSGGLPGPLLDTLEQAMREQKLGRTGPATWSIERSASARTPTA